MIQASDLSPQNPWPGLLAYNEADRQFFFGRKDAAEALLRLVRRSVLTVVFGPSGAGKTSLIQAGLFPQLRAEGFSPLKLRLDHTRDLVEQVRSSLSLQPQATLWEGFHRLENAASNVPVVVFDQFEEIFTLGEGRAESAEFLDQLADLAENYFPASVRSRLEAGDSLDFDYDRQDYRIVLVLREEFVWRLDVLRRRMPAVMSSRQMIEPFTVEQALDVVAVPGAEVVEPEVAGQIVEAAASKGRGQRTIDPAILSLLCRELNKQRSGKKISTEQLQGYRDRILSDFWENSVSALPEESRQPVREFVEDFLVTPDGFRTAAPRNKLAAFDAAVNQLIESRVLRSEERFGSPHLELTHDVLCPVVRKSRDERLRRQAEAKAAEELRQAKVKAAEARQQAEARASEARRRLFWVGGAAVVLLVSAGVSFVMGTRAVRARNDAMTNEGKAKKAQSDAEKSQHLLADALLKASNAEDLRKAAEDARRAAEDKLLQLANSRNTAPPPPPPVGVEPNPVLIGLRQPTCQALLKAGFRGAAKPLSDQDIREVTQQMGIEVATLWACVRVETAGVGFLPDGRPTILFERHFFHRLTGGRFDDHPDISNPQAGGYGPTGANQYTRLLAAADLDCVAALSSASWGMIQTPGSSYAASGFNDVASFVEAQTVSEGNQLRTFAKLAQSADLVSALKSKDWQTFARKYNGANYAVNQYDTKLAQAYQAYVSGHVPDLTVRAAQLELMKLGLYRFSVDGFTGTATTVAIVAFQQQHSIPPDGIVAGRTKDLLLGRYLKP